MAWGWSQHRGEHFPGKKHGKHQHLRDQEKKQGPQRRVARSRQKHGKGARRVSCPPRERGRSVLSGVHGVPRLSVLYPTLTPAQYQCLFPSPFWHKVLLVFVLLCPVPDFSVTMAVTGDRPCLKISQCPTGHLIRSFWVGILYL